MYGNRRIHIKRPPCTHFYVEFIMSSSSEGKGKKESINKKETAYTLVQHTHNIAPLKFLLIFCSLSKNCPHTLPEQCE